MKEYRIVATRYERNWDGKERVLKAAPCIYTGTRYDGRTCPHSERTWDVEVAKERLAEAIEGCRKFDEQSWQAMDRHSIRYTQTNIRIQERYVSDWEDL